jgi:hypothetical protein
MNVVVNAARVGWVKVVNAARVSWVKVVNACHL